jgi:hypothetical protein
MRIVYRAVKTSAVFAVAFLLVLLSSTAASASEITKTYSFGPGTGTHSLNSTFKDFAIPCGTPGAIAVTVSFKRFGPADQSHSFSLDIAIHEPVVGSETQGRIPTGAAYGATVHTTERSVTVNVLPTQGGCSRPWMVRIRSRDGPAPYTVSGSMTLKYSGETRSLSVSALSNAYLKKGESRTLVIETAAGCGQGRMVITGTWNHTIGIVPGPMPIALKFELLNDAYGPMSGGPVVSASGYSNNEARSELTKLRLTYQIPECRVGQWKLRITNVSDHEAFVNLPTVKMSPTCP